MDSEVLPNPFAIKIDEGPTVPFQNIIPDESFEIDPQKRHLKDSRPTRKTGRFIPWVFLTLTLSCAAFVAYKYSGASSDRDIELTSTTVEHQQMEKKKKSAISGIKQGHNGQPLKRKNQLPAMELRKGRENPSGFQSESGKPQTLRSVPRSEPSAKDPSYRDYTVHGDIGQKFRKRTQDNKLPTKPEQKGPTSSGKFTPATGGTAISNPSPLEPTGEKRRGIQKFPNSKELEERNPEQATEDEATEDEQPSSPISINQPTQIEQPTQIKQPTPQPTEEDLTENHKRCLESLNQRGKELLDCIRKDSDMKEILKVVKSKTGEAGEGVSLDLTPFAPEGKWGHEDLSINGKSGKLYLPAEQQKKKQARVTFGGFEFDLSKKYYEPGWEISVVFPGKEHFMVNEEKPTDAGEQLSHDLSCTLGNFVSEYEKREESRRAFEKFLWESTQFWVDMEKAFKGRMWKPWPNLTDRLTFEEENLALATTEVGNFLVSVNLIPSREGYRFFLEVCRKGIDLKSLWK